MTEIPLGFGLYRDVVGRLADGRPEGGGLRIRCPLPDRHRDGDRHPSAFLKIGERGELVARCYGCGATWRDFVDFVGLPVFHWFPGKDRRRMDTTGPRPKRIEDYPYTDEHGELLAVKVRFEPGWEGRKKDFLWNRPMPEEARRMFGLSSGVEMIAVGNHVLAGGGFAFEKKSKDGKRAFFRHSAEAAKAVELPSITAKLSLYRLPELVQANPAAPVLIVEGERKADRLAALGFVATSGYAGAGKWEYWWGSWLKGRRVCVIPDRDGRDVSLEYAHKVFASAAYYEAAEIRVVELPIAELKPQSQGGDIVDWLERKFPADTSKRWTNAEKKEAVSVLCKTAVPYRRFA